MKYKNRKKHIVRRFPDKIQLGNDYIERAASIKSIGVTIDDQLKWGEHMNGVSKKLVKFWVYSTE